MQSQLKSIKDKLKDLKNLETNLKAQIVQEDPFQIESERQQSIALKEEKSQALIHMKQEHALLN